jgi:hypothetical protein
MSTAASEPAGCSRDSKGQFLPNNPGGPGNPFARQVALLRKALIAAVSPEDFTAIAGKLKEKALAGELPAIKLLFGYVLGKPTAMPDPDEIENRQLKEQEKLETAIGRIVLPILGRLSAPEDDAPPPPPAAPSITGSRAATVNKPTSGTTPTPPPSGRGGQPSSQPPRSTNGPAATPAVGGSPSGVKAGSGQQGMLADLLGKEDVPFRPGCEQIDLAIVSSP